MNQRRLWLLYVVLVVVLGLAWWRWPRAATAPATGTDSAAAQGTTQPATEFVIRQDLREYASAATCLECHPKQHASWHASFHRTMTQRVTPETVLADFSNVSLATRGRSFRLWKQDNQFWVDMVDPDWDEEFRKSGQASEPADPPRVRQPILMSTGSHHFQTYWIAGQRGNELWQVPWVYHLSTRRWMPAEDAFLAPPDAPRRLTKWNDNCIQCHAVGGQPGLDPNSGHFTSRVADLGIACEACHGPGQKHIAHHRSLQAAGRSNTPDQNNQTPDPIVNPSKLPHDRASQVCGQCHSYFSFSDESFWLTGFRYRPGDDLHQTRMVHHFTSDYVQSRADLQVGYWKDGTMRLAGREYAAMDDSRCFTEGKLSCLSCHSQHDYEDPSDLLTAKLGETEACLRCHQEYRDKVEAHTHHRSGSSGSNCLNCHMPHTSFGLLKGIRSHRIDSPTARMTAEHGRPNACNLCHAGETLEWTAKKLQDWYGQEPPELKTEDRELSSALRMLLGGDAAQRAVVAWNMGRPETVEQSPHWPPAFLAFAFLDEYAAVRFVAHQSLRRYPGFEEFAFDFLGGPEERADALRRAITAWRETSADKIPADAQRRLLLNSDGTMRVEEVQKWFGSRDTRPILLPE